MTANPHDPSPADGDVPLAIEGRDSAAQLHYIAQLSGELAQIARTSGLPMLAYLLSMAREEATGALTQMRQQNRPDERKRR
ncbi:hypothetical protein HDIA_2926 [Hartmannibacter diazotrophicus]|uniref:Uncharacterized protein n=1 Tax=Hartmannibacter diazotrophicus TaxID=1482074 RepID=A0A2C9D829_9HYPH|nr:hypothetical protein HDIA_2926 [Hartmannibacter diazotrophicus]